MLKVGSLLFELHSELIFDLQYFAFFVLLESALVVLNVGSELLVELLESAISVLVCVPLHLIDIVGELHAGSLCLI